MQKRKTYLDNRGENGIFRFLNCGFPQNCSAFYFLFFICLSTCIRTCVTEKEKAKMTVLNRCPWSPNTTDDFSSYGSAEKLEEWTFEGNDNRSLNFKMAILQLNCSYGAIRIPWTKEIENTGKYVIKNLTSQGELIWQDADGLHSSLPHTFCVDPDSANETDAVTFVICKSGCTVQEPCVRKCCHPGFIFDPLANYTCTRTTKIWKPFFYSRINHKSESDEQREYSITYDIPKCQKKYIVQLLPSQEYDNGGTRLNLLLNGSLVQIKMDGTYTVLNSGQFCIDGYSYSSSQGKANYSGSEWDQLAVICLTPTKLTENVQDVQRYLVATFLTISAFFLFLTDIVYLIVWRYKNIHEWLQFACATSFLFAFSTLAVVLGFKDQLKAQYGVLCKILGSLIHFSFLSAFFWMTSMNFDLWFRFSGCRPLKIRSQPSGDKKKFMLFAIFSLGFPFLFSFSAVAMDYIYHDKPDAAPLPIPGFGVETCYFTYKIGELPYAKGPGGILFLINILFFLSTVFQLRRYQQNTELARTNSNTEDKIGFRLFTKLFVVMGVLWFMDFVSWAVEVWFPQYPILNILMFLPTDVLNSLQGLAIFIIYICKPNILNQLKSALGWKS